MEPRPSRMSRGWRARSPRMMPRRRGHRLCRPTDLTVLAADLQTVWFAPTTDTRLKKRIVRTVIHEVVADIDDDAS